jgi:hypothetical protein
MAHDFQNARVEAEVLRRRRKRWRPASPFSRMSFPRHGPAAVVALMILLETSWFLALGAAHSGNAYFPEE